MTLASSSDIADCPADQFRERWGFQRATLPLLAVLMLVGSIAGCRQEPTALEEREVPGSAAEEGPANTFQVTPTTPQPERPRATIQIGRRPGAHTLPPLPDALTTAPPSDRRPRTAGSEPPPRLAISQDFAQTPVAPPATEAIPIGEDLASATAIPEVAPPPDEEPAAEPLPPPDLTALLLPPADLIAAIAAATEASPSQSTAVRPPLTPPSFPGTPDPDVEGASPAEIPPLSPEAPTPSESVPDEPDEVTPETLPEEPPPVIVRQPEPIAVEQFVVTGSTVFNPADLAAIALATVQGVPDAEVMEDTEDAETANLDPCPVLTPEPVTAPLTLTPSQLLQASDAIEQCYIRAGYVNSGTFIAETELTNAEDGTVEISVVEGQLEAINVDINRAGPFALRPSYVESRLRNAIGDPFNLDELVDAVRLLELDPLINQISTELVPGTRTGTSVLNTTVTQDDGFDITLFLDNDRSPSVGSFRQGVALSQANILGIGDRFSFGFNRTEGSRELNLGYTVPINARNGLLGFNFTRSNSEVIEEPFTILDIFSTSRTFEFSYRQPLILTPTQEFALSLRASRRTSQAEFLEGINGEPIPFPGTGADEEGRTRITALRFGQEWISRDEQQVIALLSEFSFGLDLLDATIQPVGPDARFLLWRGQGQWVRRLGDALFIARGNVQLSDRPLLPNEQFSFGGQNAGRGYRLNTLLRDNGWFLSGEVRVPVFRDEEDDLVVQIAPFLDVGGGWNNDDDFPDTLFLTSTGLGLILDVSDRFSARLDWGVPLSDFDTEGNSLQDSGLYFSIRMTP
ncbi:MAG: ShlB/FhaC/HecB family hemolysin secretion/activation protein [Cyanobacteria bacterium J06638_28]